MHIGYDWLKRHDVYESVHVLALSVSAQVTGYTLPIPIHSSLVVVATCFFTYLMLYDVTYTIYLFIANLSMACYNFMFLDTCSVVSSIVIFMSNSLLIHSMWGVCSSYRLIYTNIFKQHNLNHWVSLGFCYTAVCQDLPEDYGCTFTEIS